MKNVFTLLLLFTATKSFSQNVFPPAYEIKTDTALYAALSDKNWQILEDPSGKLTIGLVSKSPFAKKFVTDFTQANGINYSTHFFGYATG